MQNYSISPSLIIDRATTLL